MNFYESLCFKIFGYIEAQTNWAITSAQQYGVLIMTINRITAVWRPMQHKMVR
jgi:hypothetical protein